MHVVIVTDQHPDSLGGAQVSVRLQRASLERAGHTVTIVAPRRKRARGADAQDPHWYRGSVIELPAIVITKDRDYAASWPGRANVRRVLDVLQQEDAVDLVHVQGDFWGALIGHRLAQHLVVPVVTTMHNNLDVGTRAVTPLAGLVFTALGVARRFTLGPLPARARGARGGWRYLAALAIASREVVVPSQHFARDLEAHGVPGPFSVVPTGVDDDVIDLISVTRREPTARAARFIWCGRMSPEKRVIECIEAFLALVQQGVDAELVVVGAGLQLDQATSLVRDAGIADRVRFTGPLSHNATLTELYHADVLVQTSVGFETQGMTPYEAAALGTPSIFCDHDIAAAVDVAPAWIVPENTVNALQGMMAQAAAEIHLGKVTGEELRVPMLFSNEMRQSARTAEMLAVYARAVG